MAARTILISSILDLQSCLPKFPSNFTLHYLPISLLFPPSSHFPLSLPTQTQQALQEATICIADPSCAAPLLPFLPNLEWWQSTWAGVEPLVNYAQQQPPTTTSTTTTNSIHNIKVTRLGGCFGLPIAEFVFAHILAHERHLLKTKQNQHDHHWPPPRSPSTTYRPLSSMKMVVLGVGSIGGEIVKLGRAFGMEVSAVKRKGGGELEGVRIFCCGDGGEREVVGELLREGCDFLVNTLPSTPLTKNLLNRETLSYLEEKEKEEKRKPVFINVGRADITNQVDLLFALKKGWFRAAVLDVFDEEPLPSSSPLWDQENIFISPHCSGLSFPEDVVKVFMENLALFVKGEKMKFELDWERGY